MRSGEFWIMVIASMLGAGLGVYVSTALTQVARVSP
jgi:hypothetical protein